jgi:chemotaxis protein CheD
MAHIMLPDSTQNTRDTNPAKYADTGIDKLIREMLAIGANRGRLKAKIAGGAQMFAFNAGSSALGRVGDRNVEAVKAKLSALNIPILAEDTGQNYGRTIEFFSEDGRLVIKAVGKILKTI